MRRLIALSNAAQRAVRGVLLDIDDTLTMNRQLFDEIFHVNLDEEKGRFVFVGDSPNDQPAFAYFPNAVGVANVRDFSDQLKSPPAFVTEGRAGDGFVELTSHLLAD